MLPSLNASFRVSGLPKLMPIPSPLAARQSRLRVRIGFPSRKTRNRVNAMLSPMAAEQTWVWLPTGIALAGKETTSLSPRQISITSTTYARHPINHIAIRVRSFGFGSSCAESQWLTDLSPVSRNCTTRSCGVPLS